jgi:hypothetical protein
MEMLLRHTSKQRRQEQHQQQRKHIKQESKLRVSIQQNTKVKSSAAQGWIQRIGNQQSRPEQQTNTIKHTPLQQHSQPQDTFSEDEDPDDELQAEQARMLLSRTKMNGAPVNNNQKKSQPSTVVDIKQAAAQTRKHQVEGKGSIQFHRDSDDDSEDGICAEQARMQAVPSASRMSPQPHSFSVCEVKRSPGAHTHAEEGAAQRAAKQAQRVYGPKHCVEVEDITDTCIPAAAKQAEEAAAAKRAAAKRAQAAQRATDYKKKNAAQDSDDELEVEQARMEAQHFRHPSVRSSICSSTHRGIDIIKPVQNKDSDNDSDELLAETIRMQSRCSSHSSRHSSIVIHAELHSEEAALNQFEIDARAEDAAMQETLDELEREEIHRM